MEPQRVPKLPLVELEEAWGDAQDGEYVQLNDDGSVVYVAHGCYRQTIVDCATANQDDTDLFALIREWMEAKKYWPDIWSVNDHGNVTLRGSNGEDYGGMV